MNTFMTDGVPFTKNACPVFYAAKKTPRFSSWAFQVTQRWETPRRDVAKKKTATSKEVSYHWLVCTGFMTFLLGFLMAEVISLFI